MAGYEDDDLETGALLGADDLDALGNIGADLDVMEGTAATSPKVGSQPTKVVTETGTFPSTSASGKENSPQGGGSGGESGHSNGTMPAQAASSSSATPVSRNTVQAIQRRRAMAAAAAKRGGQDRIAFYCLLASMGWAVVWFLYAISSGKLQTLQNSEDMAGFVGQGLIQVVRLKITVFVRIPVTCALLGFVWLRLLWWRPKLIIWLTLLGNGVLLFSVSASLLFHGNAHQSSAVTNLGAVGMIVTVFWTCHNCLGMTMEDVELAGALVTEGRFWLRAPVPPESKTTGRFGRSNNKPPAPRCPLTLAICITVSLSVLVAILRQVLDKLPLVTFTLLLLSLLVVSLSVAGAVHLYAITHFVTSGTGTPAEVLWETGRWLVPSLLLSALWTCAFLKALYQCVISQLVSTRYFNGKSGDKNSGGGAESGAEEQGGARNFGEEEQEEEGDGDGFPSALGCLNLVVERHARAVAMGSGVLDTLLGARTLQLFLERFGRNGKRLVSGLFRSVPGLVHAVYVSPHAFAFLAQRNGRHAFLTSAKASFKLFARNPPAKLLQGGVGDTVFTAAAGVGLCTALVILGDASAQETVGMHAVTILVGCWLGTTAFSYLASVAHYCNLAVAVCYAQELEASHPDPPSRCSKLLLAALEACHDKIPARDVSREQHYSAEREALDSGDAL